jgi:hypothetical protein
VLLPPSTRSHFPPQAQLFNGDFSDFDPGWYAQVGSYLVLTFAIQTVSPLAIRLLKYYIINPLRSSLLSSCPDNSLPFLLEWLVNIQKFKTAPRINIRCNPTSTNWFVLPSPTPSPYAVLVRNMVAHSTQQSIMLNSLPCCSSR